MSLIKCPECGEPVSTLAETCPRCGCPVSKMTVAAQAPSPADPAAGRTAAEAEPAGAQVSSAGSGDPLQAGKEKLRRLKHPAVIVCALLLAVGIILAAANSLNDAERRQVQDAYNAISMIGDVTLQSESKITRAETIYNALSSKCKRHVKNRKALTAARDGYDSLRAEAVSGKIAAIGGVTVGSARKIASARSAYNALSDQQRKKVSNASVLDQAEEALNTAQINRCISAIDAIGPVTIDSLSAIQEANTLYNNLTEPQKASVTNHSKLQDAWQSYSLLSVANCISLIDAIGEVTLDSERSIKKAELAYKELRSDDKKSITNYAALTAARETFDALKKEADELAKTLAPGDVIKNGKWEFTFVRAKITAKILPNSMSGYYHYYSAPDDLTFVDLVFTIKNVDVDVLRIENTVTSVDVLYDRTFTYSSYSLYTSVGNDVDPVYSWDSLNALDSCTLHVAVRIPRAAQSNGAPVKATIRLLGQEKIINVQ